MSADTDTRSEVLRAVAESIELEEVVGDGNVLDAVEGEELGSAVGGTLGASLGRRFGQSLTDHFRQGIRADERAEDTGETEHESDDTEENGHEEDGEEENGEEENGDQEESEPSRLRRLGGWIRSIPVRFLKAFVGALATLVSKLLMGPVLSAIRVAVEKTEFKSALRNALLEVADGFDPVAKAEEATETVSETAEDLEGSAEEAVPEAVEELRSGGMDTVRKETYRDILEMLSYSDLQSIAKDVGVKANLDREEMTNQLVENLSEREDGETEDAAGEEERDEGETE